MIWRAICRKKDGTIGELMDSVPQIHGLVPCDTCNKPAGVNARAELNRIVDAILNGAPLPLPPLERDEWPSFLPPSCCRRKPRLAANSAQSTSDA